MIRLFILRLLESYFQHRWLYLIPIVILSIAGGAFLATSKPTFTAESVLYIQEETFLSGLTQVRGNTGFSYSTAADTVSGELSELLLTDSFMRAVVKSTDLEAELSEPNTNLDDFLDELQEQVWVERFGANLISVKASHEEAELAQQLSQSIIDSYISWKLITESQENIKAQEFYAELLESYEVDLTAAHDAMRLYLEEHPLPLRGDRPETEVLEVSLLQDEIDLTEERLKNALDKEEDIRLAINQSETIIEQKYLTIDAPDLPTKPNLSRKKLAISLAAFVMAGVVLSLASLLGSMMLDRSFRSPIDVNYHLNLPVLAVVPTGNSHPASSSS